jgi:long-chain acyl-CoA synthetase
MSPSPLPTSPLSPRSRLRGARVVVVGGTGFLGKVFVAHLLARFDVEEVVVVARESPGRDVARRVERELWQSPCFSPLRSGAYGAPVELRARLRGVAGDVARPLAGLAGEEVEALRRAGVDVVVNLAGDVRFDAPIDRALRVNAHGPRNVASLCEALGDRPTPLVHVSTCFVAGAREGRVDERAVDLAVEEAAREVRAGLEVADAARARPEVAGATLRERAARRRALDAELRAAARERATARGFPNAYTWSKALGEALLAGAAAPTSIVRPSIVESTVAFPFPGWNEGLNASAPLVWLGYRGHRQFPTRRGQVLDVVPADLVSSALVAVSAAALGGETTGVFQVGTSDSNPLAYARLAALSGRAFSQLRPDGPRRRPVAVPAWRYRLTSTPAQRRALSLLARLLPRRALDPSVRALRETERVLAAFEPFTTRLRYEFSNARTRALFERVVEADRELVPFAPRAIDWDDYWCRVHVPGLIEWTFPTLRRYERAATPRVHRRGDAAA